MLFNVNLFKNREDMSANVKHALLALCLFLPFIALSQELNRTITDPKSNKEILYGHCDRSGLEKGDFGRLFQQYYKIYEPDMAVISQLKFKKEGVEILIVLGTWCSDSQEQVPKFFKVLDKIKFSKKSIQLICVDSNKDAGLPELENYNIRKVPTFIVYRKGMEIGRIIETPSVTLEKDLLMLFSDN